MRVAALYDIHGNLPALEAVLEDVRRAGVDRVVVGGDVCPVRCRAESLDVPAAPRSCPCGSSAATATATLGAGRGRSSRSRVPEVYRRPCAGSPPVGRTKASRLIDEWPATLTIDDRTLGDVLFCHATPQNDTDDFHAADAEERLTPIFEAVGVDVVVCGHTHMQFDRTVGAVRVVNAGSVGMPFGEPAPTGCCSDPDVQLQRTAYDLAAAAERIRATSYPQAGEFAARSVLQPPAEQEMLELFRKAELR